MDVYKTYCHLRGTQGRSNASINLTCYCPPQADPLANNVFRQNPHPGDSFSVQNSGHRVEKNETKSPPPGIICLVRMPRYQRNRVSFQIFQFSFIMRIKYSQVFIQHLRLILLKFEDSSKIIVTVQKAKVFFSDNPEMCYTHLSRVFCRLNMPPVSRFKNFLCPGSDDGSSSNNSGRWKVSKVYCQ